MALQKRFGERLSYGLRMAIVLAMLPKEQQDRLYERGTFQDLSLGNEEEDRKTYDKMVEDLTRICNTKEQQVKPTPLEVGNVNAGSDAYGWGNSTDQGKGFVTPAPGLEDMYEVDQMVKKGKWIEQKCKQEPIPIWYRPVAYKPFSSV